MVRSIEGGSRQRWTSSRSRPGAVKPVQHVMRRWVSSPRSLPEFEPIDGCRGELGGLGGKQPHAFRRAWEPAAHIEGGRVELRRIVLRGGRQEGIAALDAGPFRHATEYGPLAAIFGKQRLGKANKACVHIVGGYRSRYAVDVSARHEVPDATLYSTLQAQQLVMPIMGAGGSAIMALIEQHYVRRGCSPGLSVTVVPLTDQSTPRPWLSRTGQIRTAYLTKQRSRPA